MRAILIVLITAVAALWIYFAVAVGPQDARRPGRIITEAPASRLEERGISAVSLHNEGVALNEQGKPGDALLYFERARDFRPMDTRLIASYEQQQAYVAKRAWARVLVPSTLLVVALAFIAGLRAFVMRRRDRSALSRLRLRGGRGAARTAAEVPRRLERILVSRR